MLDLTVTYVLYFSLGIYGSYINQVSGECTAGRMAHSHPSSGVIKQTAQLRVDIRNAGRHNPFRPALDVVEEQLIAEPAAAVLPIRTLVRYVQRRRQVLRPREPRELLFELDEAHIPEPLKLICDVQCDVPPRRNIILASDEQLQLLTRARHWYVDGTYKVVGRPFNQLYSIHAFIKSEEGFIKQIPLVFILMNRKSRSDYRACLDALIQRLPMAPDVRSITADFEAALWLAVPDVLGDGVQVHGCVFHFHQALYRKLQSLGLAQAYNTDEATRRFCRKVMALPFLPSAHIAPVFRALQQEVVHQGLIEWMDYIHASWIVGAVWPPAKWCVFGRATRTNNDVEGWHRRINTKARQSGNYGFYQLCALLATEAAAVNIQVSLVGQGNLVRCQRAICRSVQAQLFRAWDLYNGGGITVSQVHNCCVVAPV